MKGWPDKKKSWESVEGYNARRSESKERNEVINKVAGWRALLPRAVEYGICENVREVWRFDFETLAEIGNTFEVCKG